MGESRHYPWRADGADRADETKPQHAPWWGKDCKKDRHEKVFATLRAILRDEAGYREEVRLNQALYGEREIGASPVSVLRRGSGRVRINVIKSLVDTVVSKIGSKRPKVSFLTQKGDRSARRNGEEMTNAVEAVMLECGFYGAHAPQAFRDACVAGNGYVVWGVERGPHGSRVRCHRARPEEIVVDRAEGEHGAPPNLYHLTTMSRGALTRLFPECAELIRDAPEAGEEMRFQIGETFISVVAVCAAYHLPVGGSGGLHVIALPNGVLYEREWPHDFFPVTKFTWSPPQRGYYGTGIPVEVVGLQYEINQLLTLIQRSMHLVSVPRVFVPIGSKLSLQQLSNEVGGVVTYTGMQPPTIYTAQAMHPEVYNHLKWLITMSYDITGVSQMSASARNPLGAQASGAALREYNDMETERFAAIGQAYEESFLDAGRVIVALLDELAESEPVSVTARGESAIWRVDWSRVRGAVDEYEMRLFPTNLISGTPAGQMEKVVFMMSNGLLDPETGRRLLNYPDLAAAMEDMEAPADLLDAWVEEVLDGDEGALADPPADELLPAGLVVPRVINSSARALAEGVPPETVRGLTEWLTQYLERRQPPADPMAAAPTGQPPAPASALPPGAAPTPGAL